MSWTHEEKLSIFFNAHIRGTRLESVEMEEKTAKLFHKVQKTCDYAMDDAEMHEVIKQVVRDGLKDVKFEDDLKEVLGDSP